MIVVTSVRELRRERASLAEPVGVVPTMGALHDGHLALVRQARQANSAVVVSIFVNPKQFGPNEDLSAYPRDLDRDLGLLSREGVDLVFAPDVDEMYPPGFSTSIDVGPIARRLEGASRPGHFTGVATVVARLFNLIEPQRAYFGQKDAQQCAVVRRLIGDLAFPIELVVIPTVREVDGLALSSRNVYLNKTERVAARALSRSLFGVRAAVSAGECCVASLRSQVETDLAAEALAQLDYVEIVDGVTFEPIEEIGRPAIAVLAARIGKTRLIDNVGLTLEVQPGAGI